MTRIPSLDGLRGVAILIVLLSHFNHLFKIQLLDDLFGAGIVGVYIFFVLSGFLITTLLMKEREKNSTIQLDSFYMRRVLRIVPLSWIYILIIIVISYFSSENFAENFWVSALYLTNISSVGATSYFFLHYWSLAAEEQYYLLVPPLLKYFNKFISPILVGMLALSFVLRYLNTHQPNFVINLMYDIFRNLDGLLIGSLFALSYQKKYFPLKFLLRFRVLINILFFPLLLFLNHETQIPWLKFFANHSFYSLLIGILIVINSVPSNNVFFKFLNSKLMVEIGVISYSLYIWQQLFSSGIISLPPFINLVLTFIVAYLSYHYFEKPFLNIKRKYAVL